MPSPRPESFQRVNLPNAQSNLKTQRNKWISSAKVMSNTFTCGDLFCATPTFTLQPGLDVAYQGPANTEKATQGILADCSLLQASISCLYSFLALQDFTTEFAFDPMHFELQLSRQSSLAPPKQRERNKRRETKPRALTPASRVSDPDSQRAHGLHLEVHLLKGLKAPKLLQNLNTP